MITEQQYQIMKKTHQTSRRVGLAALKSGMHRKTAARYLKRGISPTLAKQARPPRPRTAPDPLAELWPLALAFLQHTPHIEAKGLFVHLLEQHPRLVPIAGKALRTFQRKVKTWRLDHGPEPEVTFPQMHRPGAVMQFDWTDGKKLGVTIGDAPFDHLLAHAVLPYSNMEWAIPCLTESTLSLKAGAQAGYWHFGGVTRFLQTDQSSTATHQLSRQSKKRGFNREYLALCAHLRVEPQTIHVRSPNENGDVESLQGHLKNRIELQLQLRGSRDFKDVDEYRTFVAGVCARANHDPARQAKFAEERLLLQPLPPMRYPDYIQEAPQVSREATIRIKKRPYSVPARLIGCTVQVQYDEWAVRIYYRHKLVVEHHAAGDHQPRIDYRHVIHSLVKKPGAFARLRYRDQLFPSLVYRQAHVQLQAFEERLADRRYLQLLLLASALGESVVEGAIATCLREQEPPTPERVRALLQGPEPESIMDSIKPFTPELASYDRLLEVIA